MLKDYFYRLLSKYCSIYIRPGDRVLYVYPRNLHFLLHASKDDALIVTKDFQAFPGFNTVRSLEDVNEFPADYIVLEGNLQYEKDIISFLKAIHDKCTSATRVIVTYYSKLWNPVFKLATQLKLRDPASEGNWVVTEDMYNFAQLSGFETIRHHHRILLPLWVPLLSDFLNRWLAPFPFFRNFAMLNFDVLRPVPETKTKSQQHYSVSVVIPARNESGNIENAILRTPVMGPADELIFIEGHSTDDTWEEIQRCKKKYDEIDSRTIKIAQQDGIGKKDAVYKGLALAEKDILMILDGDLTVPPEDLPKFYEALTRNLGEFINGSRLVYSLEHQSMRFLNILANKLFALAFSFVLSETLRDTLCGTKVFTREIYKKIMLQRTFFGEFDPFGDFDLIFGANRLGLKIVEVPVHYKARTYGDTNISRFRHGLLLFRMLTLAARRLKFI